MPNEAGSVLPGLGTEPSGTTPLLGTRGIGPRDRRYQVTHRLGHALALPDDGAPWDVVWTQNSGMNIADKEQLYAGFARPLRPGGLLAIQEPMTGPGGPRVFPVMWARDAGASFLRAPEEMRALIEAAGFRRRAWDDVTEEMGKAGAIPPHSIQRIVMGDALDEITRAGQRNRDEGRIVLIQAVFERPPRELHYAVFTRPWNGRLAKASSEPNVEFGAAVPARGGHR